MHLKVLLVEDDPINRDVISWYLKSSFEADVAENGIEALDYLSKNKYDLILMDINLGKGINGIEVTNQIRNDHGLNTDVPVIALTAYAMKGDREKFLETGFADYLPKPFLKDDLLSSIKKIYPEYAEKK